ncbi:MAG: DsbA family oxidoreductase, partial [Natronospirillum sp.]
WCVVGSRNLQQALDDLGADIQATVSWRPFQLNPQIAAEGENLTEHIMAKYGSSAADSQAMRDRLTQLGASTGFRFNFSPESRTYNTFDAHRVMHWAREQGCENAFMKALFDAYFTAGKNPSAPETLHAVADSLGLDKAVIDDILASDQYREEVTLELAQGQQMGITGVPTVIINDRYAITGGQPPDVFKEALLKIATEPSPDAP